MKKVFFGLAVAVVALSASAFTNAESKTKLFDSPFLIQSVTDQFRPITAAEPGEQNCEDTAQLQCYYERVAGKTLPAPTNGVYYTPTEISSLLLSGTIVAGSNSSQALYVP